MAYNGIGAYFSGSGAPIRQGAAGLGNFFTGPLPPVRATQDGSLGEYFGGDNAAESAPSVFAFQDGVLGAPRGSSDGPLMAYKDGSLGMPLHIDGRLVTRPVTIHHGPMNGALPSGALRAYRDGVLGAADPATKVANLRDPATLKETKGTMAMAAPGVALADPSVTQNEKSGGGYFDTAFYDSPVWGAKSSELWSAVSANILKLPNAPYKESDITREKDGNVFPTPTGLFAAIVLAFPPTGGFPPAFQNQFPNLFYWATNVVASGGKLDSFKVTEPFFTEGERVKGKGFSFASISGKGWLAGAAVATLVGGAAYYVIKKK
jgi:hypothetical protein